MNKVQKFILPVTALILFAVFVLETQKNLPPHAQLPKEYIHIPPPEITIKEMKSGQQAWVAPEVLAIDRSKKCWLRGDERVFLTAQKGFIRIKRLESGYYDVWYEQCGHKWTPEWLGPRGGDPPKWAPVATFYK